MNITIEPRIKPVTTTGGAKGYRVGAVNGVEWIGYTKEEAKGMKKLLKRRMK